MDARAPAVVAVVVAGEPGPWFEQTLTSLARQDYGELSVLVLVPKGAPDPSETVAACVPDAYVRYLEHDAGFGASVDEGVASIEGAAFFLLCHDDVDLAPDVVHLLVEESFRSNAGIVGPKQVSWNDPRVLLHVGWAVDKTGATSERVQSGEVDHGQHDVVKEVFAVPGGCTLIRSDLFVELGGFDPAISAMGEDLDLCWRAQVAGARVVLAPNARIGHLEALSAGIRLPPRDEPAVDGAATGEQSKEEPDQESEEEPDEDTVTAADEDKQDAPDEDTVTAADEGREASSRSAPQRSGPRPSLQLLQRRHELRCVLKCYSPFRLLVTLPQIVVLALGEMVVALFAGDAQRARTVRQAWWWNLRHLGEVRQLRRQLNAHRRVRDKVVRSRQTRGSVRLSTYANRLLHQGYDVAHAKVPAFGEPGAPEERPELTGSVGMAFSEDAHFDELDDFGRRRRTRRTTPLSSSGSRVGLWVLVAAFLIVGSRGLLGRGFPVIAQLAPFGSWTTTWHQLVAGWQPAGVGNTAPSTPAFAVLGVVGTILLGAMGLTQKVLVLGCIPLGAWGVARLLRPLCSPRGRAIAAVAYLGLPLSFNALAQGRWDGLVAYALTPWLVRSLARAGQIPPYGDEGATSGRFGVRLGHVVMAGAVAAVAIAFAPAMAIVLLLVAVAMVVGAAVIGAPGMLGRTAVAAVGSLVVALALLAPWVIGVLAAGAKSAGIFGLTVGPWSAPSWSALARFAVGPVGHSWLSWFLIAAAFLPLLIARRTRLEWAARFWVLTCASWLLAWIVARGWWSPFSPSIDVVLAPAACGVAACIGLGVSAFEVDLSGYRFGWRQMAGGSATLLMAVGLIPVIVDAGGGQWGLPTTGYAQSLSWLSSMPSGGGFRVLWLGDPRSLPSGGWSIQAGLAEATSENTVPGAAVRWAPAGNGPAAQIGQAVQLAMAGKTTALGQLLAPEAIRYIVLTNSLAPSGPGIQSAASFPLPSSVLPALLRQGDLRQVPGGEGFSVFQNIQAYPERSQLTGLKGPGQLARSGALAGPFGPRATSRWYGVLPGPAGRQRYEGSLARGPVLSSYAPAGSWHLTVSGQQVVGTSAYGWASRYQVSRPGVAAFSFDGSLLVPVGVWLEIIAWIVLAAVAVLRRRRRTRQRVPIGQRLGSDSADDVVASSPEPVMVEGERL